jgi:hypothetical protein
MIIFFKISLIEILINSIAEPLFQEFGAKVEFHPVMVFDDLKKAVQNLGKL